MNNVKAVKNSDEHFVKLKKQTVEVIQSSAVYLNTREINVFEYLKDDRLIQELTTIRKTYKESDTVKLDEMIRWLDEEWFSYKLNERMAVLYTLHPF